LIGIVAIYAESTGDGQTAPPGRRQRKKLSDPINAAPVTLAICAVVPDNHALAGTDIAAIPRVAAACTPLLPIDRSPRHPHAD